MTNGEMEQILKNTATKIPTPKTEFKDILKQVDLSQKRKLKTKTLKPIFIALALCILFGAGVYASKDINIGGWLRDTSKADIENKYDVIIRDTIGNYVLKDTSKIVNTPNQYEDYSEAVFHKVYEWESIDYFIQDNLPPLSISIGKTDNELWKYVFNYMEDGKTYDVENLKAKYEYEIEAQELIEYRGRSILYLEKTATNEEVYKTYIQTMDTSWVDYEKGFVVSIDVGKNNLNKEQFLEYVTMFIDDYIEND